MPTQQMEIQVFRARCTIQYFMIEPGKCRVAK